MVRGEIGNAPTIEMDYATGGEIGNALDISVKRRLIIRYGNECFEIEAMLSICLYQQVFTFIISFDRDTLMTKSHFCPNF